MLPSLTSTSLKKTLLSSIHNILDYPKLGIMFHDITTLLGNAPPFGYAINKPVYLYIGYTINKIADTEGCSLILGGAITHQMSVSLVSIRKKDKLP